MISNATKQTYRVTYQIDDQWPFGQLLFIVLSGFLLGLNFS
jgi:hypothetical protein